jgi:hypothetical protein
MEKSHIFARGISKYDSFNNYVLYFLNLITDEFYIKVNRDVLDIGRIKIYFRDHETIQLSTQHYLIKDALDQMLFRKFKPIRNIDMNNDKDVILKINLKNVYQIMSIEVDIYNDSVYDNISDIKVLFEYNDHKYSRDDICKTLPKLIGYIFREKNHDEDQKHIDLDNNNFVTLGELDNHNYYLLKVESSDEVLNNRLLSSIEMYDVIVKKI